MKDGMRGNEITEFSERELLRHIGETCTAECECAACDVRLKYRLDICKNREKRE